MALARPEGAAQVGIVDTSERDGLTHVGHHGLIPVDTRVGGLRMPFGQGHNPERRRHPGHGGHLGSTALQPAQLGGAAADIHHQHRLGIRVDQVETALDRQPGLLDGVDDAQLQAGASPHPLDELGSVVGLATGLGRDGHQTAGVQSAPHDPLRAEGKGVIGPVHGPFVQTPGAAEPFAQAHDAAERIHHVESVPCRPRDQQPAVVGPQVESPVQRAVPTARLDRRIVRSATPLVRGPVVAPSGRAAGLRHGPCFRLGASAAGARPAHPRPGPRHAPSPILSGR